MRGWGALLIVVGVVLMGIETYFNARSSLEQREQSRKYAAYIDQTNAIVMPAPSLSLPRLYTPAPPPYPREVAWSDEEIWLATIASQGAWLFLGGCVLCAGGVVLDAQRRHSETQRKMLSELGKVGDELADNSHAELATLQGLSNAVDDLRGHSVTNRQVLTELAKTVDGVVQSMRKKAEETGNWGYAGVLSFDQASSVAGSPAEGGGKTPDESFAEQPPPLPFQEPSQPTEPQPAPVASPAMARAAMPLSVWWPESKQGSVALAILIAAAFAVGFAVDPLGSIINAVVWYLVVIVIRYFVTVQPSRK